MMTLIEFLLDNIFFVVIIIAVLSSFFGKLRSTQSNQEGPGNGMPPFMGEPSRGTIGREAAGGGRGGDGPRAAQPSSTDAARTSWPSAAERSELRQSLARFQTEEGNGRNEREFESAYRRDVPARQSITAAHTQAVEQETTLKTLTRNEAVQGMMWAEIFGPPRAKRPYRNPRS
jgi:hypothetical protein